MFRIYMITIAFLIAAYFGYDYLQKSYRTVNQTGKGKRGQKNKQKKSLEQELDLGFLFIGIMVAAFIARLIGAVAYFGNETDMNCFIAWGDMIYNDGFKNFYLSDSFTDYPPGYMYILYVIAALRHALDLTWDSSLSVVLTKMPAMLADLGIGYFIYRVAGKYFKKSGAAILSAFYLFCPAVILDSAVWGQTDSVYTLFVVWMCYLITEKKLIPSYFSFAVAILLKPQALMFAPVLIFGIIDQVFLEDFNWKKFGINLGLGIVAILMIGLFMLPFGFQEALAQYTETLGSYEYATVNAYNIWTLFGKNWAPQADIFLGLTYKTWGTVFIVLTVIASGLISFRAKKNPSKYYLTAAFIITSVFLFSVRMHERYIFPAIIFLLLAYAIYPKKEILFSYLAIASCAFLNMAHVEFVYDVNNFNAKEPVTLFISFLMLLSFAYMIYMIVIRYNGTYSEAEIVGAVNGAGAGRYPGKQNKFAKKERSRITSSVKISKLTMFDFIAMAVIVIVYSIVAFARLGNMDAPETTYSPYKEGEIILDMGEEVTIASLWDYLGYQNNPHYDLSYTNDENGEWTSIDANDDAEQTYWDAGSVFCWNEKKLNISCRYFKIAPASDNYGDSLIELVLTDEEGNLLRPVNAEEYANLFDEQDLYHGEDSNRSMYGTYFDEIYHGRTAYEMIHHLYCYENTHPPLGKELIALGVLIFGMNPFGWRFMGTLFGVLMLPFFYLFARRFLKGSYLSACTTLLFAFDFMHFTQTRIATIDVYVTFFIILSYYFMFCYVQKSFYDTELKKTFIPLGLCGIAMGLSWASKWTGIYSAAGLCVIFFAQMFRRYLEYRYAVMNPTGVTEGIPHQYIRENFQKLFWKTIIFCCVFFILVPALIYMLSYIPFSDGSDRGFIQKVIEAQRTMFNYHKNLEADHPYSSKWYQWPTMYRPIWYYSSVLGELREGISAFGNPLVWWAGIPATAFMLYLIVKKRDEKAGFLIVGYLSQYAPWLLVSRTVFIYHYFPSVPFITMMLGYSFYQLVEFRKDAKWKKGCQISIAAYVVLAIGLFALFYPVLSGLPIHAEYATKYLKWFDTWVLLDTWS